VSEQIAGLVDVIVAHHKENNQALEFNHEKSFNLCKVVDEAVVDEAVHQTQDADEEDQDSEV
jgi:hypothetical protein